MIIFGMPNPKKLLKKMIKIHKELENIKTSIDCIILNSHTEIYSIGNVRINGLLKAEIDRRIIEKKLIQEITNVRRVAKKVHRVLPFINPPQIFSINHIVFHIMSDIRYMADKLNNQT